MSNRHSVLLIKDFIWLVSTKTRLQLSERFPTTLGND